MKREDVIAVMMAIVWTHLKDQNDIDQVYQIALDLYRKAHHPDPPNLQDLRSIFS